MTTAETSVADLDQFSWAVRLADVLQLIPVPASRTQEINPEVVNGGFAVCELQVNGAALAFPHGVLPLIFGECTPSPAPGASDNLGFSKAKRILAGVFSLSKRNGGHRNPLARNEDAGNPLSQSVLLQFNSHLMTKIFNEVYLLNLIHVLAPFFIRRIT